MCLLIQDFNLYSNSFDYCNIEEPRSKPRGSSKEKALMEVRHPHTPLAIHPGNKLQGFLAFSHKWTGPYEELAQK